ncbi:MAG TPA: tyrosine-type recombinase/integrase [Hyphomonadaceae bacterium]|nr:tyrosine-type recombinase/integrase [Hyphomonadaceae bacterium]
MRKFNEQNERIKRAHLAFLKEAKGQDEKSLDKVATAVLDFEEAIGFKPFKAFHRNWATTYKRHLEKRRNVRSGQRLGVTTRDATLRLVKGFIEWLAGQPGYRSRIAYADAAYFNNNAREARAAHAARPIHYPSLEQCAHAFRMMPEGDEVQRRDKAILAFLMLTGGRVAAIASLRLSHVDLVEGKVYQDGREVRTKNGKTIETWFFPVDTMYRECFVAWVHHLRDGRLHGPGDALFPKAGVGSCNGRFAGLGLSREPYANAQAVNAIVKRTFREAGLREYTAHSIRKTLAMLGNDACKTMEDWKAWSQNLGHEHLATTVIAYMPVPAERQRELLRRMANTK